MKGWCVMSEKVKCMECGKPQGRITNWHLQRVHNMTMKTYRAKYPDAELVSDETKVRTKYAKAEIFTKEDVITDEESKSILTQMERSPIVNRKKFPQVEELDLSFAKKLRDIKQTKKLEYDDPKNLISKSKLLLLNYLISEFADVRNNFFIEKLTPTGVVDFKYITDIVIYDFKVILEFPNSFWHNNMLGISNNVRTDDLIGEGWKIVNVNSKMPTVEELKFELIKHKLIRSKTKNKL
jgi:hypothetical protein